jgi:hypothetical protein
VSDCNPHPDAPHGFDRNASATEDRYVCDCEYWHPPAPTPGGAREAVARALTINPENWRMYLEVTDEMLAALKPFIAAEIRAWAEARREVWTDIEWTDEERLRGETARAECNALTADADAIASRICGGER